MVTKFYGKGARVMWTVCLVLSETVTKEID